MQPMDSTKLECNKLPRVALTLSQATAQYHAGAPIKKPLFTTHEHFWSHKHIVQGNVTAIIANALETKFFMIKASVTRSRDQEEL